MSLTSAAENRQLIWESTRPQHNIQDGECTQYVYEICQLIAQRSDNGRKALIEQNILPVVLQLVASQSLYHIDNACGILKALAHSGTYRAELITTGVKAAMDRITRFAIQCLVIIS